MNYEGIAARLYDAHRAGVVLQRLQREGKAHPDAVTVANTPDLVKKSRLPAFEGLDANSRQLWIWQAESVPEIIAAAVLA